MSVNRIIHVSPVDYSGTVRCYTHELEASRRISQTEGNSNREFYCCSKDPEHRCDFFFWVDQLTAGTPHQPPPMSQTNSSTPSRTSQVPRTPSKLRLDAIEEALAEKKSDPRANGNNQFTTPSSRIRAQKVKTPGQLKRDEEIRRAVEPPSQSTQQSNDANVFQSSQPPPSNYKLTPLSQESINHSDEDDFFAALPLTPLPLTPPTTQRIKRSRDHDSDEESEPDFRNSPSKNKGKKKVTVAHDSITPTTSANDVTDTFSAPASLKLSGIIDSLEVFRGQVAKLERQIKALKKSNEAKLEKIQNLETDNHALKSENDELRGKIQALEDI
ncbi:hypothetical protein GGU11DRAFT_762674 [Lentinula aff. detonsa]|uniref:GRF-type domain-containing protein n=1 Tax=Lentinula aff. detonsa TaxID=2804958 RepID=A0AA38U194_9AGAR|nr:hypothetical protein GGU10DRAFT_338567 [Lentinula aff. detonsa]KAJ3803298.1 hypothetical protein GGU11DRAFT_762674 [Lentinula aff. detonsa]